MQLEKDSHQYLQSEVITDIPLLFDGGRPVWLISNVLQKSFHRPLVTIEHNNYVKQHVHCSLKTCVNNTRIVGEYIQFNVIV